MTCLFEWMDSLIEWMRMVRREYRLIRERIAERLRREAP
jgi:hypothetical protein